jgi:hypothetical protein
MVRRGSTGSSPSEGLQTAPDAAELLDRLRVGFKRRGVVDEQVPAVAVQEEGATFERAAEPRT